MAKPKRLSEESGDLPNNYVTSVAAVGDDLYIGLASWGFVRKAWEYGALVSWNRKTKTFRVIASSARKHGSTP